LTIIIEWQERKKQEALHKYRDYGPVITDSHFVWDELRQVWLYSVEITLATPFPAPWEAQSCAWVMNAAFPLDPSMNRWVQDC
jgi:hypothetical protein